MDWGSAERHDLRLPEKKHIIFTSFLHVSDDAHEGLRDGVATSSRFRGTGVGG